MRWPFSDGDVVYSRTMETIERPPSDPSRVTSIFDRPASAAPPRRWPYRVWRGLVAFLTTAAVAFTLSGLVAFRDHLAAGWQNAYANFRWAVLVSGDQIELDEIGRYLKQLDGVNESTLLPSAAIMDRLRREPLLENHLSALDAAQLPSIWEVTFLPTFDLSSMDDTLAEVRRLPGVVDITFDRREVDQIRFFRGAWLKVKLLLSGLALIGVLLGSILLGRFLFFTPLRTLKSARLVEVFLVAAAGWFAGLAMAQGLIGPFSWQLAWGALAAGLTRVAAGQTRRFE